LVSPGSTAAEGFPNGSPIEQEVAVMGSKITRKTAVDAGIHDPDEMLTPKEYAKAAKVSLSWLAKARKRGDGPPFIRFGRSVRYFPLRKPD
jgi:hypothetical protein